MPLERRTSFHSVSSFGFCIVDHLSLVLGIGRKECIVLTYPRQFNIQRKSYSIVSVCVGRVQETLLLNCYS